MTLHSQSTRPCGLVSYKPSGGIQLIGKTVKGYGRSLAGSLCAAGAQRQSIESLAVQYMTLEKVNKNYYSIVQGACEKTVC